MIFTLCGSARFEKEFKQWSKKLFQLGHPCFTLAVFPSDEGSKDWYTGEEKSKLDLLHLRKIERSDAILVLNVGGYVGESNEREILYARLSEKKVYWLERGPYYTTTEFIPNIWE